MIKRFLKDSLIYGAGGLLTKCVGLLLLPLYINYLSPQDFGVMDYLVVVFTLLGVFFSLEIYQAVARFYNEFATERERKETVSTAFLFIAVSYLLLPLLILLLGNRLSEWLFRTYTGTGLPVTIFIASIAVYFSVLLVFCQNILRYQFKSKIFAVTALLCSVITILFSILFVTVANLGMNGLFIAQLIGNFVAFIISVFSIRKDLMFYFDFLKLKKLLSFSLPLVPASISVFLLAYLDRILINSYLSVSDLGIYGVANRFASISALCMGAISTAITPLVYENYKKESTKTELSKIFSLLWVGVICITFAIGIFGKEIFILFTNSSYYAGIVLLPFLVLTGFISKMYDFTPGLFIAKRTKSVAFVYIVGVVINLGFNFFLMQMFGLMGTAISGLLSAAMVFAINFYLSQKHYKLSYEWKRIGLLFIFASFLYSVSLVLIKEITLFSILMKLILFLGVIVFSFMVGLLKRNEVFRSWKNIKMHFKMQPVKEY